MLRSHCSVESNLCGYLLSCTERKSKNCDLWLQVEVSEASHDYLNYLTSCKPYSFSHRALQCSFTFLGFELISDSLGSLAFALSSAHFRSGNKPALEEWVLKKDTGTVFCRLVSPGWWNQSQNSEMSQPKALFAWSFPKPRALNLSKPRFYISSSRIRWLCKEKKPKAICRAEWN